MGYIGEHLLPGQLGHFFIVLSLVASLVATFSFFMAARDAGTPVPANGMNGTLAGFRDPASWKKLARFAFITEVISVVAIFGILFYIIHSHLFEYKYGKPSGKSIARSQGHSFVRKKYLYDYSRRRVWCRFPR